MNVSNKVNYNLKDFEIFHNSRAFDFSVWIPDKTYIILGRANTAESSVFLEKAQNDNIRILKRPSGGETVILSPDTLVVSVKMTVNDVLKTHDHFEKINLKIIDALEVFGVKDLKLKGISDISIGPKKILGSSIYRKHNILFYHAVLNVSESVKRIEKYLKYPKREPDYRKGRSHSDFVTSVYKEGYDIDLIKLKLQLEQVLHELDPVNLVQEQASA
jgi:lipoate-protein ligase A